MTLEEILKSVDQCGLTAALITGDVSRCYLYPTGVNPEQGHGWIGYADSTEGLVEAIAGAMENASRATPSQNLAP